MGEQAQFASLSSACSKTGSSMRPSLVRSEKRKWKKRNERRNVIHFAAREDTTKGAEGKRKHRSGPVKATKKANQGNSMLGLRMRSSSAMELSRSDDANGVADRLSMMRRQESLPVYLCDDYLLLGGGHTTDGRSFRCAFVPVASAAWSNSGNMVASYHRVVTLVEASEAPALHPGLKVDEYCREQMCEWCFRLVDHFQLSRQVVSFAAAYFDRFLSLVQCDKNTFKLAVLTALFVATKIHGARREILPLDCLAHLSRGEFSERDVLSMEAIMLEALEWRMHPPTAACFVQHLFGAVISSSIMDAGSSSAASALQDRATFFSELAACNYSLATCKSSHIALASILNAIEGMSLVDFTIEDRRRFINHATSHLPVDPDSVTIKFVREQLWGVYRRSEQFHVYDLVRRVSRVSSCGESELPKPDAEKDSHPEQIQVSPTCVSHHPETNRRRFETM